MDTPHFTPVQPSDAGARPQIAPLRMAPKTGPSSWKHLDLSLALEACTKPYQPHEDSLAVALERCADEARADDWSAELFLLSARETLRAGREKLLFDTEGNLLSCEARDHLIVELLDRAIQRFFSPC